LEVLEDRTVPSPLAAGPTSLHATEGLLYDGPVGTFTDGNAADTAAGFTATVSWGDGTTSPCTVTGSNGKFTVSGQHPYAEEGNYPLTAVVTELDNGASITLGGPPQWTPLVATLPGSYYGYPAQGRGQMGAAAGQDGKIYAIGGLVGFNGNLAPTDEVDAYDPVSQTWTQVAPLPTGPRWDPAATTGADGTIYAIGGLTPTPQWGSLSSEVDAYNPTTNTWTQLPGLPDAASHIYPTATTGADGTIYVIGGFNSNAVDAYNPQTQTWRSLAPLPTSSYFLATATGTDGTIYAIGGTGGQVDAYNPTTNAWTVLPPLPTNRYGLAAAVGKDGTIYAIGGQASSYPYVVTGEVDAYNPVTQTWTVLGQSLPTPRITLAAATGTDGTIYAMGGQTANGSWSNEVDTYLPPGQGANTAAVADAPLSAAGTNFSTTSLTLTGQTLATFTDSAPAEPLADYAASIDWNDGSTPQPGTINYDPGTGQFSVLGSHTYVQNGKYTIIAVISHDDAPAVTVTTAAQVGTNPATTTTLAISSTSPLAGVDSVSLTASVTGSGTPTGSVDFFDTTTGQDLGPATLAGGVASLTAGAFTAGEHDITATYSGDPNFLGSSGTASLTTLAPASLSGVVWEDFNNDGQVDFGEKGISGVSITLTGTDDLGHNVSLSRTTDGDGAYVFAGLRPGSYYLTKASQPAGYTAAIDSAGTAGGGLVAADQFFIQLAAGVDGLNYNYGERPAAGGGVKPGQTAGIGFWNNKNGQALIKALNGGASSTQLANWLAATLPNTFGIHAGGNNLTGQSNAYVAALFQQDFVMKGVKLDAQVLATALSVYATNATLDPTKVAARYGFTVSGDGAGTAAVNVGCNGDAFGVANNTTLTLMDLLLAADAQAVNGVLYGGNAAKRNEANSVFSAVNQAGAIS
jgi:N-acetylneuraminic acid mutarotase